MAKGMTGVLDETLQRWFTAEALATEPEPPGSPTRAQRCSRSTQGALQTAGARSRLTTFARDCRR